MCVSVDQSKARISPHSQSSAISPIPFQKKKKKEIGGARTRTFLSLCDCLINLNLKTITERVDTGKTQK